MWIYKKEAKRNGRKLLERKYTLCTSMRILVRVIKSRRTGRAGHVSRMVESRGLYRILVRKPGGKEITWKTQV